MLKAKNKKHHEESNNEEFQFCFWLEKVAIDRR